MQSADELIEQLEQDGEDYFGGGFGNNIADLSLSVLTVLGSLTATALIATPLSKWVIGIVAAIPAAATSIQKITGVRQRANWYFMYSAQVRSLATKLKYGTSSLEEVAEAYAKLQVKMESEWMKIGQPVATSRHRGRGGNDGGKDR